METEPIIEDVVQDQQQEEQKVEVEASAVEQTKSVKEVVSNIVHSSVTLHDDAKLIQVTGKQEPFHFINVPLSKEFLNLEDIFIMQSDAYIFVWCSEKVNIKKKAKAVQMAAKLKVEIGCQRAVQVLEIGEEHPTFLYCLGVVKGEKLNVTKESNDIFQLDEENDNEILEPEFFLYQLSTGADGKPTIKPMEEEESIKQEMLESNSCFILDCEHEMYIWQGKGVKKSTKETLIPLAKKIWSQYDRPEYYVRLKIQPIITMVFDGAESCLFKSKFTSGWIEKAQPLQTSYLSLSQKKKDELTFDVKSMHEEKEIQPISIGASADFGNGKLLVWSSTTNGNKWSKVDEDDFGIFYSNKCYVCHYIYKPENKNSIRSAIFYWEGLYGNQRNYIGFKFGLYKEIQKKMQSLQSDDPVEYRISQNKEPKEFINLFGTELLVLNEELAMKPMIFQVRGNRGTQLYPDSESCNARLLNSLDSFVFLFPNKYIIVWHGVASTEDQKILAADLFTFLPAEYEAGVKEFDQGSESDNFWKIIGGNSNDITKNTYCDDNDGSGSEVRPKKIKLFLCTENSGIFKSDQINPYSQVDLNSEECLILDVYFKVFIWKGSKSTDQKLKDTQDLVRQYIETANDERPSGCPVELVEQYNEPSLFKSYFHSWKVTPPKVFIDPIISYKQKLFERLEKEKQDLEKLKADAEAKANADVENATTTSTTAVTEEPVVVAAVEEPAVVVAVVQEQIVEKVEKQEESKEDQEKVNTESVDIVSEPVVEEVVQKVVVEQESTIVEEDVKVDEDVEKVDESNTIDDNNNKEEEVTVNVDVDVEKEEEKVDEAITTTTTTTSSPSNSPTICITPDNELLEQNSNSNSNNCASASKKNKSHEPVEPSKISSSGDLLFAYEFTSKLPPHSPKQGRKGGNRKNSHIKQHNKKNNSVGGSPTEIASSFDFPKSLKNDVINQDFNLDGINSSNDGVDTPKSPLSSSTSAIPPPSTSVHNTPKKNNKNKNKKKQHNRSNSLTNA